jgi:hypothetical protein
MEYTTGSWLHVGSGTRDPSRTISRQSLGCWRWLLRLKAAANHFLPVGIRASSDQPDWTTCPEARGGTVFRRAVLMAQAPPMGLAVTFYQLSSLS